MNLYENSFGFDVAGLAKENGWCVSNRLNCLFSKFESQKFNDLFKLINWILIGFGTF